MSRREKERRDYGGRDERHQRHHRDAEHMNPPQSTHSRNQQHSYHPSQDNNSYLQQQQSMDREFHGNARADSYEYDDFEKQMAEWEMPGTDYGRCVTGTHYRAVKRMQRVVLGATTVAPKTRLLQFSSIGLVDFFSGKQERLFEEMEDIDVTVHEALEPLRLIVEFISFVVSGLVEESRRIEDAIVALQKDAAMLSHELRRYDVELQYRMQYVGTNVTRALAHYFGTRNPSSTTGGRAPSPQATANAAARGSGGDQHGQLRDYTEAMHDTREQLKEIRRRLKALTTAQTLLRGAFRTPPSTDERNAIIDDLSISQVVRSANHKLRDALLPFAEDAQVALPSVISLQEFVLHVDIGLTAATDDLDACLVSLKKFILFQQREQQVNVINERKQRRTRASVAEVERRPPSPTRLSNYAYTRDSSVDPRYPEVLQERDGNLSLRPRRSSSSSYHDMPPLSQPARVRQQHQHQQHSTAGSARQAHNSESETDQLLRMYCT